MEAHKPASTQGKADLGDIVLHGLDGTAQLGAHVEHLHVVGQDKAVDLIHALFVTYPDYHVDELVAEPLALEGVVDNNGKLRFLEVRLYDQPSDPDDPPPLSLTYLGHDCHLSLVVDVAQTHVHLVGDLLDDLEKSLPQGLFRE